MAASEALKEAFWLRKFLDDLEVIPDIRKPIAIYCDNSGAVANSKEPRSRQKSKHIECKYHIIRDFIERRDVTVCKFASEDNIADPFTKALVARSFDKHIEAVGMQCMSHLIA